MSYLHSPSEWAAVVSLSVGIYAAALVPFLLLVDTEDLVPAWSRVAARRGALSATVCLMLITINPEGKR